MPKSRASRAAAAISRMVAGGGFVELTEDVNDLSDAELAEVIREWEASLSGLDSEEVQRQRQEINQLLVEYRRSRRGD